MLTVEHVFLKYHLHTVLHDITFHANKNQFVVFIGPNGAGKSSLLRAIAGTTTIESGVIQLNSRPIQSFTAVQRAQHIAVVPQAITMPAGFTVREVVSMARYATTPWFRSLSAQDESIVEYALAQSGIQSLADVAATQLSGGEQQRVAFARALAQQPHVLLLDETTAHLDLHHQQAILRCAKELTQCGILVIAAMHDINLAASVADTIVLLHQGRIMHIGKPQDVLTQPILESVYDTNLLRIDRTDSAVPFFMAQP